MIPELGHFCLILAMILAALQTLLPYASIRPRTAFMLLTLSLGAFLCLMVSYITSDFSVSNVAANSHTLKPMIYKISGVWGNHEGSMLLWLLILTIFGFALSRDKTLPPAQKSIALQIQGALALGFLAFILFTSNPFLRLYPAPLDGQGLNPLLQDLGLAIHPPLLYIGYVGFSATFSLAIAALITGNMDQSWARSAKPYTLAAWSALSGGIALGSWWAYYELGWGGWWFWDPVENASLMPWLLGTALVHSLIVLEKRGGLVKWTSLLAILTFSLSMLGTFLVRSGILTSVHSFANDPQRGLFVLGLLCIFSGGALALYALRAHKLNAPDLSFTLLSRESSMMFNNLFMVTACATVFIGTLYPLFAQALDMGEISVGAPYFNMTILPICLPALLLMGAAPAFGWKKTNLKSLPGRLSTALMLSAAGITLILIYSDYKGLLPLCAVIAAIWLLFASAQDWLRATKMGARITKLPLSHHGMSIAHIGMAIAVLGMVGTSAYIKQDIRPLNVGEQFDIGRYTLRLEAVTSEFGENYAADTAIISVFPFSRSQSIATLKPQRRYYPVAAKTTTESAIYTDLRGDLYVAISENPTLSTSSNDIDKQQARWLIRAYTHPLIPMLWGGFALIAVGGLLSLFSALYDKRKPITQSE